MRMYSEDEEHLRRAICVCPYSWAAFRGGPLYMNRSGVCLANVFDSRGANSTIIISAPDVRKSSGGV